MRSHIQPEDTQLFAVDQPSSNTDEDTSATKLRDINRVYEALHAKMEDERLYMHGWKFPTVYLAPMDEKHLTEIQTRLLTAPDQAQTVSAVFTVYQGRRIDLLLWFVSPCVLLLLLLLQLSVLLELSGSAMVDYPAAVFLQQPGFLLSLLHLLTLPDTNVVMGTLFVGWL